MWRFLVVMSVVIFCSPNLAQGGAPSMDVKVTATAVRMPSGAWHLKFFLVNNSDQPVRIYEASLPWGIRTSLTLLLLPEGFEQSPLSASQAIDDPGPRIMVIAPHSETSGDVDLNDRFPDLGKVTKTRDVLAFWSYQPRAVDDARGAREFGGALLANQSRAVTP